jgi:plasmid stabilization system protein ParE
MADVFVTDEAQADLDAIDQYILQEFGVVIADKYHADMLAAFGFFAESPATAPVFRKQSPQILHC